MSNTENFGMHLMVDGYGGDKETLSDETFLTELLLQIPKTLQMHIICEPKVVKVGPLNRKDPGGISGFVMIAESHISFHTFPDRRFVTLDIYTCQNDLDIDKVLTLLQNAFRFEKFEHYVQPRGVSYPNENIS